MILHYLMPEAVEMYSAKLDVLCARIEALKRRERLPKRPVAGACHRRLKRIEGQCRSLRRLLFRLERSDALLHERLGAVVAQACCGLSEVSAELGGRADGTNTPDAISIRIEPAEEPSLVLNALQSAVREKSLQKTN